MATQGSTSDLWIFGYGSLMWKPDFVAAEAVCARLEGYHRSFCVYSVHHRGTEERPGLVLGLDRGGSCTGIAFRISAGKAAAVLDALRAREQVNGVYREARVELHRLDGSHNTIAALAYIAERAHPSYAGRLSLPEQAKIIRSARGRSGVNVDYFASTLSHLKDLGIRERQLERLSVAVSPFARHSSGLRKQRPSGSLPKGARRRPARWRPLKPAERRRFTFRLVSNRVRSVPQNRN